MCITSRLVEDSEKPFSKPSQRNFSQGRRVRLGTDGSPMCAAPLPSGSLLPSVTLLEAASDLIAEHGPRSVTQQQIADRAGMSMEAVQAVWPDPLDPSSAALAYLGTQIAADLGPERHNERLGDLLSRALGAIAHHQRYARILTWCLLEGHDPRDLKREFPVISRLVRAANRTPGSSVSAETVVAGVAGAAMGLLVYGPYLQVGLGQGDARWLRTRGELVTLIRRQLLRAERR